MGDGVGGSVLQMSTYSQSPVMRDMLPKLSLQQAFNELYDEASAIINSFEQEIPSKKKT
jgi:hypothetical protein